jgi:hypothetical protein
MAASVIDTLIAEAGSDPDGLAAVAWVIQNRAQQWGMTPEQVVKQKGQFEGYYNPGPKSREAQKRADVRAKAEAAWNAVQAGTIPDPTNGGTSFRTKGYKQPAPNGTVTIAGNTFALGSAKPNSAISAINAAAPLPMPARPPTLSAFAPIQTDNQRSLQDALNAKVERIRAGTDTPASQKVIAAPQVPRVPGFASPSLADTRREAFRPVAPARGVGTPNLTTRSVRTVPIDPLTGNPITATASAPRPVSKPPSVTYVPRTSTPTPFQTANRTMVQGLPIVGPIVTGLGTAADLVQRVAPATAQAKPATQPTTLPSVIPPTPKGYNTLTGKYETMQPSTPYVAGPAPVRTADKAYTSRIYPVASAPTMQETLDEQALMRRPTVPVPRMPMNPTAAMMAVRQPRVVQAPPPMPRPRPVIAQPRQVQQPQPAARPTTGGLLGLLFGSNTSSGPISVPNGNPDITYTDPGIVNPGSGKEINGIDIAFMPKAVQQSSRWNTGY